MKHSHFYLLPKEQPFPRGEMFHRPICSQMQTTKFLDWKLFTAEVSTLCFGCTAPSTAEQVSRHHLSRKHKQQSCWSGFLLMSPRGCYIVHKKNGEFGGNERREREKSACVGDRKTDRGKRVRLQRQTVEEKEREVQFSTCFCLIRSTSIIMHQNNSFFFFPESVIMFHR